MTAYRRRTLLVVVAAAVIAAGCASSTSDSTAGTDASASDASASSPAVADEHPSEPVDDHDGIEEADDHASETFAFGRPADAADADRTVAITATDDMTFEPSTIEVRAGEVVTFEVTNVGQIPHDFTLGDEDAQRDHASEMAEMDADEAHADPNTVTLRADETGSITWQFDDAGEVLYGCHQPGHYAAGMVGSVDVSR